MSKNKLQIITLNKPGITDFADERNSLLSKSNAEWIFFVDSDEEISDDLAKEIEAATAAVGNLSGFKVYRKNYFLGKYVGTDNIVRLGKRGSGRWVRAVHETWQIKGEIGQLKYPLIHNTARNVHEFIDKINFYSTLHAQENLKLGNKSSLIKIVFFPMGKFFQSLLIGRGFVMSMLQSFHSFLAWSKEWILQNS